MAHGYLNNLVRTGDLKTEPATVEEVSGLIGSGTARLSDAKNPGLSVESKFDLAYNAAHALSLAALRIAGYRAEKRYLVFQCLRYTLDFPNEKIRVLDEAHRKRNLAEYEGVLEIEEHLLEALIRVTEEVAVYVSKQRARSALDGE